MAYLNRNLLLGVTCLLAGWGSRAYANAHVAYVNDFSMRSSGAVQPDGWYETRYVCGEKFVYNYSGNPSPATPFSVSGDVQDNWMKVYFGADFRGSCRIANNSLNDLSRPDDSHAYAVQGLGARFRSGKVTVQADIRPPSLWTRKSPREISLRLGDDNYHRGDIATFAPHYGPCFGLGTGSTTEWNGRYYKMWACWTDGDRQGNATTRFTTDQVDPTHWYRFRAVCNMDAGTYDLTVYATGA